MNKILLVSPHLDDAILSAGHHIAIRPNADVVTVFAGYPKHALNVKTPYDTGCGFENTHVAMNFRRDENSKATALLCANNIDLDFLDSQYGVETPEEDITKALQDIIDSTDYDYIMAPLGIGHPDHRKVSNAVLRLNTNLTIWLWEDLPIRVMEPELIPERLKELDITVGVNNITDKSKMADKIRALSCYESQIGTGILDPYLLYVPERFYIIK